MNKSGTFRKTAASSFVIAAAVILAWVAGSGINKVRAQAAPVKAFQIWQYHSDTEGQAVQDTYYARRSDGAVVTTSSRNPVRTVYYPSAGVWVRSTDQNNNTSTSGRGIPRLVMDDPPGCPNSGATILPDRKEVLGHQTLHGVLVVDIGGGGKEGRVQHDLWLAPDFNCFPLEKVSTYYDASGKVTRVDTAITTQAVLGDPPADVFRRTEGMEVPPSKFFSALGQHIQPGTLQRRDARYNTDRAAREAAQ